VFAAVAMGAALQRHQQPVKAYIDGLAASAASVLTTYADSVEASAGSFVMIHNAWTIGAGNASEFRQQAELLDQIDDSIVQAYVKQTGKSEEQIREWMGAESWFEASDAVANGFADRVAGETEQVANWDLSAFDKAPQQIAASADTERLRARLRLARALAGV
jgi:ATP-dependent protease ClpP protease subunit